MQSLSSFLGNMEKIIALARHLTQLQMMRAHYLKWSHDAQNSSQTTAWYCKQLKAWLRPESPPHQHHYNCRTPLQAVVDRFTFLAVFYAACRGIKVRLGSQWDFIGVLLLESMLWVSVKLEVFPHLSQQPACCLLPPGYSLHTSASTDILLPA